MGQPAALACHCGRVIRYITHSRSYSVSDPASSQPTRWKTARIATLAGSVGASTTSAAAGVFPQGDANLEGPRRQRAARGHEGLDSPDRRASQIDRQIEPAIDQV